MEKIIKKKIDIWILFKLAFAELAFTFFIVITIGSEIVFFSTCFFSEIDIISLLFLATLWIFTLDLILWQVNGTEIISMNKEALVVKKRGKLFTTQNIINLFEIENILLRDYEITIYTRYVESVGIRGGKICIEYLGQDLSKMDAFQYVEEMNKLLFDYHFPANPALQITPKNQKNRCEYLDKS